MNNQNFIIKINRRMHQLTLIALGCSVTIPSYSTDVAAVYADFINPLIMLPDENPPVDEATSATFFSGHIKYSPAADGTPTEPNDGEYWLAESSFGQLAASTFSPQIYTVTPSANPPAGGTFTPSGAQTTTLGATKTFTVAANSGYARSNTVSGTCPQGTWNGNVWATGAITASCTVIFNFTGGPQLPTCTTVAASNVTIDSATLNGSVTSAGTTATASFELGTTTAYGTSISATPSQIYSSTAIAITANKTSLNCSTTYHFRCKAVSSAGTGYGIDKTLATLSCPATVSTSAATNVTAHSAKLNGQVNGGAKSTTVTFDLGTSLAYGISVPATPTGFVGDSPVTATRTGLSCNTLYHYRTKAVNSEVIYGTDQTFTTGLVCSETPTARLSPPMPISKVNKTFNLDVVANTNGLKVGGYNFTLGFDQTKIVVNKTYVDATGACIQGVCPGPDMPAPTSVLVDNDNGIIQAVGLSATGLGPSNDLALLTVHFQARSTIGPTPVSVTLNDLVTASQPVATIGDGSAKGATVNVINSECGDADGNGFVNIVDALAVARKVATLPPPPTVGPAADVNGDGLTSIGDAMNIARYSVGLLVINTCFVQ